MFLNRLSINDRRSYSILLELKQLNSNDNLALRLNVKEIKNITLIPLKADVKATTWAVAVSITGKLDDDTSFERNYFVKKTSDIEYLSEKKSFDLLVNSGLKTSEPSIEAPLFFIDQYKLIISVHRQGENVKQALRKVFFIPFLYKTRRQENKNFFDYGVWLANFHIQKAQANLPPSQEEISLHALFYTSKQSPLSNIESSQFIKSIKDFLASHAVRNTQGFVHGDFAPQNILKSKSVFYIIDWETFHYGHHIEDCIHFVINVLTQTRYAPFSDKVSLSLIKTFLRGYQSKKVCFPHFNEIVILLAISNIYKRQEWTKKPFSRLEKLFFVPMLRKYAFLAYKQCKL